MKTEISNQYSRDKAIADAHLGIIFKDESQLYNPLIKIPDILEDQPELYISWLMSQPDYFFMTCKYLFNITLHPFQNVILKELWYHKFPMLVASRGGSKSFTLALYALLRALFVPKRKVLICSAGFRQAKIIFGYIESIISEAPRLRDILIHSCNGNYLNKAPEAWELKVGDSSIKAIPLGTGTTIRGLRATEILSDEFDSIPLEIFETVVAGFASVNASPVENVNKIARKRLKEKFGMIEPDDKDDAIGNQIVLSGTAGYSFNHFAKYHEKYVKIIKSRGDEEKLREVFGGEKPDKGFNWKEFSIMRIPVNMLPEGFMDDAQISRAKATIHSGNYQMEYGAIFSSDSNGFFPRSIIEKCTVRDGKPLQIKNTLIPAEEIGFKPRVYGNPEYEYIMGIDPAMSSDNFAIVILELHNNHRRIVYCWTTNEKDFKERKKKGLTKEENYYTYCIRKIRQLYKDFNIIAIALDKEGGGRAILEGMNDSKIMLPDELRLYPMILPNKTQESDYHDGLHIIDVVNFSKEEYTSQSNHGMRKDMEEKELLFPIFDAISLAEADINKSLYDTEGVEETCMLEIEELKDELCTIIVTSTSTTGRERFDTPEVKTATGKKGRMRKDRYSALLMANMTARTILNKENIDFETIEGGFAHMIMKNKFPEQNSHKMYQGPAWLVDKMSALYD